MKLELYDRRIYNADVKLLVFFPFDFKIYLLTRFLKGAQKVTQSKVQDMEDHLKKVQEKSGPLWDFFKEISNQLISCLKDDTNKLIKPIKSKKLSYNTKLLKKTRKILNQTKKEMSKPSKKPINHENPITKNVFSLSKLEEESLKKINELLKRA